jgi:hypothetical protein
MFIPDPDFSIPDPNPGVRTALNSESWTRKLPQHCWWVKRNFFKFIFRPAKDGFSSNFGHKFRGIISTGVTEKKKVTKSVNILKGYQKVLVKIRENRNNAKNANSDKEIYLQSTLSSQWQT